MGAGRAWGWARGSVGAMGARAVLGALCAFLPCIPLLLCQEGPAASGNPLFGRHLPILAHLSSSHLFVGCQGETQVGGLTAEQSPSQTVCLGAKNPDFFPLPGIMTCWCSLVPRAVSLRRSWVPGLLCPLAFPREKRVLEVPGCSLTSG